MSLTEKALLVQLSVSQFTGRKLDRKATQEVADSHGVSSSAGRYNKSLFPNDDKLAAIHAKTTAIRAFVYKNTLPWGIEGTLILSTDNYWEFMTEFGSMKTEWQKLVGDFIVEYPVLKAKAQLSLGSLYRDQDYPDVNDIANKFKMDLAVFPVPSTDFRVEIGNEELERIKRDVESRVSVASSLAMQEAWNRLYDVVARIHNKLMDPAAIFRDSLIENAAEICDLLTRMNVENDVRLSSMCYLVSSTICNHNPEALRLDPVLRQEVASRAKKIMEDING